MGDPSAFVDSGETSIHGIPDDKWNQLPFKAHYGHNGAAWKSRRIPGHTVTWFRARRDEDGAADQSRNLECSTCGHEPVRGLAEPGDNCLENPDLCDGVYRITEGGLRA